MSAHDRVAEFPHGAAPSGHRLGNFELQGVAVQGPNAVVYRGWDHNLGIPVAIQEYLPLHLAWRRADGDVEPLDANVIGPFERGRQAFVNEARVLARCDHASLLRVRQLLHAHGTSYRVMPWYDGRSLLDVRRDIEVPPDEPALRALLADLLGALEAYHRVGGVHGGVNPVQILLLDDDRALLLGPGSARRDTDIGSDAAEPQMRQLEAGFLAPEQLAPFDEAPAGPWTDFFALARVVRFCISGMLPPPPGGPLPERVAVTVENLYFDAPGVRYSKNFLAALDAAASLDIGERPQTVAEFCDWLDHGPRRVAMSSMPTRVQAPPATVAEKQALRAAAPSPAETPFTETPSPATPSSATPSLATPSPATPSHEAPAPGKPASTTAASVPSPAPAAAAGKDEEPDVETIALIQRVIESIPARIEPPMRSAAVDPIEAPKHARPPELAEAPATPETSWQAADNLRDLPPNALPRRRGRPVLWLLLAVLLLCFASYAAWSLRPPASIGTERPVAAAMPSVEPAQASLVEETASAPMPSAPTAQATLAEETPKAAEPKEASAEIVAAQTPQSHVTTVVASPPHAVEKAAAPAAPTAPASPRAACGGRKDFSLYRCMQQQCAMAAWAQHPQCLRMKATDSVD